MTELVLGSRKVEVGGSFEVLASLESGRGASGDEGSEENGWNSDLGKLGEKEESVDVGGLWCGYG